MANVVALKAATQRYLSACVFSNEAETDVRV
jgi:hypothetical protein